MHAYHSIWDYESFNFGQFLALCVQLILCGKITEVRRLINAFDDPDEQLVGIKRLLDLGPYELEGMRLAVQLQKTKLQRLNLETWPHNVLLLAAKEVEDCEQFVSLLGAVEETVEWEDTFECVTRLCFELSNTAIEDVFLHSERFRHTQSFILASILRVLSARNTDNFLDMGAVIEKAYTTLDQFRTGMTMYTCFLHWGGLLHHQIYPSALYTLGMIDLMTAIESIRSRFPTIYEEVQTQAYEALHREIRDINRKDDYQFVWVLKRILWLLGGEKLFQQWKEVMHEMVVSH